MAYIVVEGPIGVGKTSLSRILADELHARLVLEVVEENPFLAAFYDDPESYAFRVQVFFLLSRYKQSQDVQQGDLFYRHTVSDYLFDKDAIFAALNLRGDEWQLYEDLYRQLRPKLPRPDLTVYLRADPDLLLGRIAKRGRDFERDMAADYLARLNERYEAYFAHFDGPLEVIEAAEVDFVENPTDRERLLRRILQQAKVA
ncbi:MAG: deoxynucleoside kinase [Trueperaceae bacterium]|nr:deoxynucleoside kinase [Trueperaceae bacterium]